MTVMLVALGAAVGAPIRYLVDRAIRARTDSVLPWGTFIVNVVASTLLGLLAGLPAAAAVMALLGSGLCGALSTYSTFSYETLRLFESGSRALALLNVLGSITVCLGGAWFGFTLARMVA